MKPKVHMNKPFVKRERIDSPHYHKDCGGLIQCYNLHLSVHNFLGLDICAGSGRVERFPTLPICTKCSSSPPIEYGCIHPITWPPEPQVANKPEPEEPKDYGFGLSGKPSRS